MEISQPYALLRWAGSADPDLISITLPFVFVKIVVVYCCLQGGYNLKPLNASTLLRLEEEREQLENDISNVPAMQTRMSELKGLLGS